LPDPRLSKPEIPADGLDMEGYLEEIERGLLSEALRRAAGNRTEAARILKLSFRSFRYRVSKLGVRD
jgi:two-component system response regulator PilR (NtrC family)